MGVIEKAARALGLPVSFLDRVAKTSAHRYKTYSIPKRSGGRRTIQHPSRDLKTLQRFLATEELSSLPIHDNAMGYRSGRSIMRNAERHVSSRFALRLDIVSFFESLREADFRGIAGRPTCAHWSRADVDWMSLILFRNGVLTIGAPSSPILSNILCYDLDEALTNLATRHGAAYTRYADDMFFSTNQRGVLKQVEVEATQLIERFALPSALRVNAAKTAHLSRKSRRVITGIVLSSDGRACVGRNRKRKVRGMIHRYNSLTDDEKRALAGDIAFAQSIEDGFIDNLILKYGFDAVDRARHPPV